MLALSGVRKSFGSTKALVQAEFTLNGGEVLALMGENGSGKSTMVKILTGVHRPDSGTILLEGREYAPRSPANAISLGAVAVYQEILTVPDRSVLENIWLGTGGFLRSRLPKAERERIAGEWLRRLLGRDLDLGLKAGLLSVSIQQAICVARALVRDPKLLILDEATSALDVETRDNLFSIVRERSAAGRSSIFISHRMDEVLEVADAAAVLRSGTSVGYLLRHEITPDRLVHLMTGADHLVPLREERRQSQNSASIILSVRKLVLRPGGAPIDFDLREGELVGLAGLEGHGQDVFLDTLARGSANGEIVAQDAGERRVVKTQADALAAQMAYVPRDRRSEGIFPTLSTRINFAAATLKRDRRFGVIRNGLTRGRFADFIARLGIRVNDDENPITTLSGGNQQKVVISRWLATDPSVLLLSDPTRGIDLGAKRDIYAELQRLTDEGVGIVMLSSEVDELIELMDRVLVFREGSVFAELPRARLSQNTLVAGFFGHDAEDATK